MAQLSATTVGNNSSYSGYKARFPASRKKYVTRRNVMHRNKSVMQRKTERNTYYVKTLLLLHAGLQFAVVLNAARDREGTAREPQGQQGPLGEVNSVVPATCCKRLKTEFRTRCYVAPCVRQRPPVSECDTVSLMTWSQSNISASTDGAVCLGILIADVCMQILDRLRHHVSLPPLSLIENMINTLAHVV